MRKHLIAVISIAVVVAACGGADDDADVDVDVTVQPDGTNGASGDDTAQTAATGDATGEASEPTDEGDGIAALPADLPTECSETPFELTMTVDGLPQYAGTLPVVGAAGVATPIVPNGDGSLDDLDVAGYKELGAETDLLLYTQWVGDFAFDAEGLGFLGGAPTLPGDNLALGLSVTPPTEAGLSVGDVVSSDDELEYDSITTFGTATLFLVAPDDVETYLFTSGTDESHGGTATVLYVDDDWLCVDWELAGGTGNPDGDYSVSGVVLTPIVRGELPYT